jgi:hypothetical protein
MSVAFTAAVVALLIVPTDPEVFAVAESAFWWAGIFLILALLWDGARGWHWLRASYLLLDGLSTPVIAPIAALLMLRAAVDRRKSEYIATAIALSL